MDVYTLIVQDRENCDGIEGIGFSTYSTLEAAVEAVVKGIVDDNTLEPSDDPEGEFEAVTEAEVRELLVINEEFGTVGAFDPWTETDWVVYRNPVLDAVGDDVISGVVR